MTATEERAEFVRALIADRWRAHSYLFKARHPEESSEAHKDLVSKIYAPTPRQLIEGFRGIGKTTYLEEAAVLRACFGEFRNMVIVGASYSRACDRLATIKNLILYNPVIQSVFGGLQGSIWQEGKIVLSTGACIQALGRDQSMLGIKHDDIRPDAALVDDVEDPKEVRTDEDRRNTWDWFLTTFLPSLDDPLLTWVRVLGTRRGKGSLPERLEEDHWPVAKYPFETVGPQGERIATWPGKFPLWKIDLIRETYKGDMHKYMQEYMCEPVSIADRVFREDMFRVELQEPSWHAVYAMVDPARSTGPQSATTGWAVWSWVGPRLIVWAAGAEALKPDQIVELIFTIYREFDPVWVGVEEDGLNEWLKQPIRTEMTKRRVAVPFKPMKAPRGKIQFIGGLQPYFNAGEVIFAKPLPELEKQLLSFPTGKIDAPNALAYALQMRPAALIYEDFGPDHIVHDLEPIAGRPLYLAGNATRALATAVLCQFIDGQIRIYADWVAERQDDSITRIHQEASLLGDTVSEHEVKSYDWQLKAPIRIWSRQPVRWVVPPIHSDRWNNVGLTQEISGVPANCSRGADPQIGRTDLAQRLNQLARGNAAVAVSRQARWTLRALTGGYCRALTKQGQLADHAEEGVYRVLMEGLESFCGQIARVRLEDTEEGNYAVNKQGARYLSAMPVR